jgi:ATP-dependent DNA ligase
LRVRATFINRGPSVVVGHNFVRAFPEWLEPMAATLTQERFAGPEWIFERKFDGIRLLAFRHGTRRQNRARAASSRT